MLKIGAKVADVGCGFGVSTIIQPRRRYSESSGQSLFRCVDNDLRTRFSGIQWLGPGAQAGEARLRDAVMKGGFTRFSRTTQTPFNLVLAAQP